MSPTVHEFRNQIRQRVGRFEREVDAQFTKEELAAIADAVGADVDDPRPSKGTMRAAIRQRAGIGPEDEEDGSAFTKSDLEAIAAALDD
ncbi:hypothetical protein HWV07_13975 [Natronomonas salina]|uniref:hypothetical protein n=1 Tax=Natronomonas salina TaxID=1710540 RepID=UPI0015B4537B|nr:hypothetical protein [Natronomonas salina]QLD90080.1 hypothetical protein HWV07_13975 [Natronomonas salina]